jgi:drug/metabolite transporter (DMT)-like permease
VPALLALCASLCWGVADYLGGVASRRHPLVAVIAISQTAGLIGVVVVVAVRGQGPGHAADLAAAVAAGLAGAVAIGCFYRAMTIGSMSVAAPILSTSVVVPVLVGIAGGDRPGAARTTGIVAAIAGIVLVSREPGTGTSNRTAVAFALIATLALGLQLVGLDRAAEADPVWAVMVSRATSLTVFVVAALVTRPVVARAAVPSIAVIGMIDTTANVAFATAATLGLLSVVAVLSSLYPVVTVGLAHLGQGERLAAGQWVGVALALAGVVLITA